MHCKSVFSGNLEMKMTLGYTNESIFTRCTFHFFFQCGPLGAHEGTPGENSLYMSGGGWMFFQLDLVSLY